MLSIQDFRQRMRELDDQLGIDTENIELEITDDMPLQTQGQTVMRRSANGYLIPFLIQIRPSRAENFDVLEHEYCHVAAQIMHLSEKNHGHGKIWKDICNTIGCIAKARCEVISPSHYKYSITCNE